MNQIQFVQSKLISHYCGSSLFCTENENNPVLLRYVTLSYLSYLNKSTYEIGLPVF